MDNSLKILPELIEMMRKTGVVRLRISDIEIELGPPPSYTHIQPMADIQSMSTPTEIDPKLAGRVEGIFDTLDARCNCSHYLSEHSKHGCLLGCPENVCVRVG